MEGEEAAVPEISPHCVKRVEGGGGKGLPGFGLGVIAQATLLSWGPRLPVETQRCCAVDLYSVQNRARCKINWAWWHMPVIPTTQEAEAGDSLGSRRQRLQ